MDSLVTVDLPGRYRERFRTQLDGRATSHCTV